jgi:phosphoribosylformylglycinamidine synthase subunit PurS
MLIRFLKGYLENSGQGLVVGGRWSVAGGRSSKFCVALNRSPATDHRLHIMKAKIYVTLKPSVLDPQGKAIHHAVETIGYRGIVDVRQGKYFEIALDPQMSADDARRTIERMAADVLANPVIEDFRVELDSEPAS